MNLILNAWKFVRQRPDISDIHHLTSLMIIDLLGTDHATINIPIIDL